MLFYMVIYRSMCTLRNLRDMLIHGSLIMCANCTKLYIYGLKQVPRAWYEMLSKSPIKKGFHNSLADSSLFVLSEGTNLVYVLVYVDDILITGNNSHLVNTTIQSLGSDFAL